MYRSADRSLCKQQQRLVVQSELDIPHGLPSPPADDQSERQEKDRSSQSVLEC